MGEVQGAQQRIAGHESPLHLINYNLFRTRFAFLLTLVLMKLPLQILGGGFAAFESGQRCDELLVADGAFRHARCHADVLDDANRAFWHHKLTSMSHVGNLSESSRT